MFVPNKRERSPKVLLPIKPDTLSSVTKFIKHFCVRPFLIARTISFLSGTCTAAFSKRIAVVRQMATAQSFQKRLVNVNEGQTQGLRGSSFTVPGRNKSELPGNVKTKKSKGSPFRNRYQRKCCPNGFKTKLQTLAEYFQKATVICEIPEKVPTQDHISQLSQRESIFFLSHLLSYLIAC